MFSCVVSEKWKFDDYDYLGWFFLQFQALFVYPADFLG